MSYGTENSDVASGKVPLRLSPIKGLSNATWIMNKSIKEDKVGTNASFSKWIGQFTKNPKSGVGAILGGQ